MAKEKKVECPPVGAPAWMASYGDTVTLVLCFFVLLFSMSTIDAQKLEAMSQAMSSLFSIEISGSISSVIGVDALTGNGLLQLPNAGNAIQEMMSEEQVVSKQELQQMASDFKTYFAEQNISEQVEVEYDEKNDFLEITFDNGILFDLGRADLKPTAVQVLDMLAGELTKYPNNDIKVEGHTDNIPIDTVRFPSNWELSAARAISVAKFYIDEKAFPPHRMSTEGFGEYRPEFPNDSPENRAKNRRVVMKVLGVFSSGNATG